MKSAIESESSDRTLREGPANVSRRSDIFVVSRIGMILIVATILRLIAAYGVQYLADRRETICLFGDTAIYWRYAQTIVDGTPYVVHQWDEPHYALRTPSYPLWLALNMKAFGERALPIRLAQAFLGVGAVWWVYRLARSVDFSESSACISASLVAIDPFQIFLGSLLLTEALFAPLLVFFVLQWVKEWRRLALPDLTFTDHASFVFLGAMQAFLALVRPSWSIFLPILLVSMVTRAIGCRGVRKAVLVLSALIFGWGVTTAPWAVRNLQRLDRFVIGGTWGGASLYDSVRPGATGASDMSFVALPEFRKLKEIEQDDRWKQLSLESMRDDPGRMVALAVQKQKRFWSAWPNDSARVPTVVKVACAAFVWPIWAAIAVGIWRHRNRIMTWLVLSPLVVTAMTHLVFVGSSRYRLAVIVPAIIFAGEGLAAVVRKSVIHRGSLPG